MASAALTRWQGDRLPRLDQVDAQCATLLAMVPPPPLAEEVLQGYVMLLSGHFQGFCRDLYTECVGACRLVMPPGVQPAAQAQFLTELRLNSGNPTVENIRKDFERFAITLDLPADDPLNVTRVTHLGHLNHWRNTTAHQKAATAPPGIPPVLLLSDVRNWKRSCDGLATSLDHIMEGELGRMLGTPPW